MEQFYFYQKWLKSNGLEHSPLKEKPSRSDDWASLEDEIAACRQCPYGEKRLHPVIGEGPLSASLVFVGEGPGREEDESGRPFVGRAGRLLRKVLEEMGQSPSSFYIANIVKCRPFNNENPKEEAVQACLPFLQRQLALINPRVIVSLGKVPGMILSGEKEIKITKEHGRVSSYSGIPLVLTFHPSFLVRPNGSSFIPSFVEDLKKALDYCP